jgi:hypothetical protein
MGESMPRVHDILFSSRDKRNDKKDERAKRQKTETAQKQRGGVIATRPA